MGDHVITGVSSFFSASDGLRLHARLYKPGIAPPSKTPIVCLPGLTRHSHDFEPLATLLAQQGHLVLCPDYRGRGLSQWDTNPHQYNIWVEHDDLKTALIVHGIQKAIFIGTSRGALHILALAATAPQTLRAAVLNDMGPVVNPAGLQRIKAYSKPFPQPKSWEDAQTLLQHKFQTLFPHEPEESWQAFTKGTFFETDDGFTLAHDPRLFIPLENIKEIPNLWPQFEGLADIPLLVIRGALSDILTQETLEEMTYRHPNCRAHVVPNQGHAPLLRDAPTQDLIRTFVEETQTRT